MHRLLKQAFTLIELLVVIAIIGILSGLIIVGMNGMTQKATIAKAQVFSNSLRNALMMSTVAQYTFDDITDYDPSTKVINSTAGNIPDSWSDNEGRAYNSPILKEGSDCVSGKCVSFDGANDYLDCGAGANLRNHTSESIFVWVNVFGYTAAYGTIVDTGYWAASYGTLIDVNPNANSILIILKNSGGTTASETIPFGPSTWMYIGFSWDGSTVTYYKNGVSFGTPDSFSGTMANNGGNLFIGGRTGNYYLNGLVDDVRMYNAAMPTSQIKEHYYTGLNKLFTKGVISKEEYLSRINKTTGMNSEGR